jgi:hypothetical protein
MAFADPTGPFHEVDVRIELDEHDQPIVVKEAVSARGGERLRREAAVLRTYARPGIVELAAVEDRTDGPVVIQQRWAGTRTLATVRSLPVDQAAGLAAALAAIVADLHQAGLAHNRLGVDHVIISPAGRPVLCGFGGATDRATGSPDHEARLADDVAALGQLLHRLVGGDVELEPIPERSWLRGRRGKWSGYQRRCLLNLADQATSDDPAQRPTARQLAANIAATVPEARLPAAVADEAPNTAAAAAGRGPVTHLAPEQHGPTTDDSPGTAEPDEWDRLWAGCDAPAPSEQEAADGEPLAASGDDPVREAAADPDAPVAGLPTPAADAAIRRQRPVAAMALTLLLLAGSGWVLLQGRRHPPRPTALPTPTSARAPQPAPPTSIAAGRQCQHIDGPATDLDGDGCREPVTVTGRVVGVGAARFEVGAAGDQVVVGDWHCNGQAMPALLRPSTGEVFVFPRYATDDLTIASTSLVAGADGLRIERRAACDVLLATRPGQAPVEIPVEPT